MRKLRVSALVAVLLNSAMCCSDAAAQQIEPNPYALVIGISGYPKFPPDQRLRYPTADARLFADFLRSPESGPFPERNLRVLPDSLATRESIFREVQWIGSQAREQDVVYVFFAGHGVKDDADDAMYLMPYDADPGLPAGMGIRADQFLREISRRVQARRILLFIDACYSSAALYQDGVARGSENIVSELQRIWASTFSEDNSTRMGFFSSRPGQRSWESDSLGHGLFTWFLVKGLRGGADMTPQDGVVRAEELKRFLEDSVGAFSRRRFTLQTPVVSPIFDPDFALAARVATPMPSPAAAVPPMPATAPVPFGRTSTRGFLPIPTYNEEPVQTSDWLQIRGWTVFYRYAVYLGREEDEYSARCTSDLRVVGDWGWDWSPNAIRVTCIDDEWLSFDLSGRRGTLVRPLRVNIRGRDGSLWGLHGNPRFLAPCLLSETGSPNLVFQASTDGVSLTRLTRVPSEEAWVSEPNNQHLDVCDGGHVAVPSKDGIPTFRRP